MVTNHDSTPGHDAAGVARRRRLRRPVRGEGRDRQEVRRALPPGRGRPVWCWVTNAARTGARRGSAPPARATPRTGCASRLTSNRSSPGRVEVTVLAVEHLDDVADFPADRRHGDAPSDGSAPSGLRLDDDDPPVLACDWAPLERIYAQSIRDLTALRFDLKARPGPVPPGRRAALVHGRLRPGQPHHQLPGAAVHARTGAQRAAHARRDAGAAPRRLPRRRAGQDPARVAVRRADGLRGAAALAVLRRRGRHPALAGAARRVRAVDRPLRCGAPAGAGGPGGAALDRRVRRPRRRRLHRVRAPQHRDRPGEPVLEGLLGLHPVGGRHPGVVPARDL